MGSVELVGFAAPRFISFFLQHFQFQ